MSTERGARAGQAAAQHKDVKSQINVEGLLNLRSKYQLPAGDCMYIQSGDPTDFDGYLIASAGTLLQAKTPNLQYVIAVPERRAWMCEDEPDNTKHDYETSERVLEITGSLLRHLAPTAVLVRGLLNQRSMVTWKFAFNEEKHYGPLLTKLPKVDVNWTTISMLKDRILDPKVTSVVLDMNGSLGYLDGLVQRLGPEGEKVLGAKMRASGVPVLIMAGVQAEVLPQTLTLPGRNPRATANAIYYPDAVKVLLRLAKDHNVPLLFVTNNASQRLLMFKDGLDEALGALGLKVGDLLDGIAKAWYGMAFLHGKCVMYDWVAFVAMLLYSMKSPALEITSQELYIDDNDPSVLVLRDPSHQENDAVRANLLGTRLWGAVESVKDLDRELALALAKHVVTCARCAQQQQQQQQQQQRRV